MSAILATSCPSEWLTLPGDYGYTPLHYICESGLQSVLAAIFESIRVSGGSVAVMTALAAQTTDMHLNMAVVQSGGMTPLHLAAAKVRLVLGVVRRFPLSVW